MKKFLASLLILIFLSTPLVYAKRQLLDRVVAVVDNEAITQSELDYLLRPIYRDYKQQYFGSDLMQKLNEARGKLLNQLIEDRLVFQKAEDEGIAVDQTEIDTRMQSFRDQFSNAQEMEAALQAEGFTLHKMEERIRRQAMIRRLHTREVRSMVVVSPKEIQRYYKDNPKEFESEQQIKIRSLTIKKSDQARRKGIKDEYAEDKINRLRKRIEGGEQFGQLATENSEDTRAQDGGLSEWIQKGGMIPVIDEVIFGLNKGALSEVVETSMGYHLFYIEDVQDGFKRSFEEVREQIHSFLFNQKAQERFQKWMEELKNEAYISIR